MSPHAPSFVPGSKGYWVISSMEISVQRSDVSKHLLNKIGTRSHRKRMGGGGGEWRQQS